MTSGNGPVPAQVMIVGDCFSYEENRVQEPFMGASGLEFTKMLFEAGIYRGQCFVTNLVNEMPPRGSIDSWMPMKKKDITRDFVPLRDRMVHPKVKEGFQNLMREIKEVNPNVIITAGNAALWALTGAVGALKWRGSLLQMVPSSDLFEQWSDADLPKVIPIVHPYSITSQWELRAVTMHDLKRVKRHMGSKEIVRPAWNFIIRPNFLQVTETLDMLEGLIAKGPTNITLDLETRAGHIACCGLAWTKLDAICIPFMERGNMNGYWSEDEETFIVYRLYKLLMKANCKLIGQNLLYDVQYLYRHWHFAPRGVFDTMIAHHSAFAGLPKALDYIASLYCDYFVQWKPEKSVWKAGG